MKRLWRHAVLFYLGGMLYQAIELIWRGWTHGSMFLMGGLCFWVIGRLNDWLPRASVLAQMLLGTGFIVLAELVSGLIVNQWLGLAVWDYSAAPYQLLGQICLPFALLWFPVSGAAIMAEDWLRLRLFGKAIPQYRWV